MVLTLPLCVLYASQIKQQLLAYQYVGARLPGQARSTHLRIYRGIPATRGGKAHFMYVVTVETPRLEQERHTHLLSYLWRLATRGDKEHFMYAVTAEIPRSGQARHTHFRGYRGNLKNVYACVL
jgi:hypothetical protein